MKQLTGFVAGLLFIAAPALSSPIVIEPDDYAVGTNLSSISPLVTLTTTGGDAVYSADINSRWEAAAEGYPTGPLGQKVFSRDPTENDEWYYWRDSGYEETMGLQIEFHQAVSSFSLLFAELFSDAGCCFSDPIYVYVFDTDGALQAALNGEVFAGYLGKTRAWDDEEVDAWPYFDFHYSGSNIGRVIVGGESEPTSIDRLTFTLQETTPVPEPAAYAILALSLFGLSWPRRR